MSRFVRSTLAVTSMLFAGACASTVNMSDPDVAACNIGGPLIARYRQAATAPKPQAIPGRSIDCAMGPDNVLRLYPPAKR
jgi:hypothetical protein